MDPVGVAIGVILGAVVATAWRCGRYRRGTEAAVGQVLDGTEALTAHGESESALRKTESTLRQFEDLAGLGYWEWELETGAITWSPGMYRVFGYSQPEHPEVELGLAMNRVHPDDADRVGKGIEEFIATGNVTPMDYRIVLPSGEVRTLQSDAMPIFDESGRLARGFGFVMDITDRVRMASRLQKSQARLVLQYEGFPIPTYTWRVIGDDLELFGWNRAADEYTRGGISRFRGARAAEMYGDAPEILQELRECVAQPGRVVVREMDYAYKTLGATRRLRVTYSSVSPEEVNVHTEDITERASAERALRRNRSLLAAAQRLAHIGSWQWDVRGGSIEWSEEMYRIFGVDRDIFSPSYAGQISFVAPEDRGRVERAIEVALSGRNDLDVVHRLVRPTGEIRYVREIAEVESGAGGSPLRVIGTTHDVTELKAAEDALRTSLAEKDVLLREVHHRVKNNLQVISSLLYMQARQAEDPRFERLMSESRERVRAMALVHETLYRSDDFGAVDFGAYLNRMLTCVWSAYASPRVTPDIRSDGAPVDIEDAVPLGLAVNELATNALQHAFPGGREGRVRVVFRGGPGRAFDLTVEDDGIGLPESVSVAESTTLGLRLVSLLATQLSAGLEVERPGSGTRFWLQRTERPESSGR